MIRPWAPSNRACTRMCGILLIAHRQGRIELSYPEALRVKEGCFSTRFYRETRACIGRIWVRCGGVSLLRTTGRGDDVSADVREELLEAEKQTA